MTLRLKPLFRTAVAMSVLVMIVAVLGGCGTSATPTSSSTGANTPDETPAPLKSGFGTGANTAQGHYDAAEKAMKAEVPDAVLISVRTGATSTDPPAIWTYLFASKKTGKGYAVSVANGTVSKPSKLPGESIRANEWAKVPTTTSDWKVDSDAALKRATAVYTKELEMAPPSKFIMGMSTFVADAKAKGSPTPFRWTIVYAPEDGVIPGVHQVEVDAKTGQVMPFPE